MQSQLASASANVQGQVSQSQVNQFAYSLSSQPGTSPIVKLSVTFPNFREDECEDVHEFILNNYKRAGRLNGWNELVHSLKHCLWLIR